MEVTNIYQATAQGQHLIIRAKNVDVAIDMASRIFLRGYDVKLINDYRSRHPELTPDETQKVIEDIYD